MSTVINGSTLEVSTLKRFAERKRTDCVLYKMAAIVAGVGAGFDLRISNTSAIHPVLQTKAQHERSMVHNTVVNSSRDAYYAAVKDSFLQADYNREDYEVVSPSGASIHNTYHGKVNRYRPNVNFQIPLMFTEAADSSVYNGRIQSADMQVTPSLDRRTPSLSGMSAGSLSPAIADDNSHTVADRRLSQDRSGLPQQHSENSSMFDTPRTTPRMPQRQGVKFEETESGSVMGHRRTPSNSSVSSSALDSTRSPSQDQPATPTIRPPPTNKRCVHNPSGNSICMSPDCLQGEQRGIERPVTLSFRPRPRPQPAGILKKSSPNQTATSISPQTNHTMPTPPDTVSSGGDDMSYLSTHSASTPDTGIQDIRRTLLDMDAIGQREDPTKPLPAKLDAQPLSITALEKEFLL